MMFSVVIVNLLVAAVMAEPPPSNSYLPPPARSGYPQGPQGGAAFPAGGAVFSAGGAAFPTGGPEVVAARSLDHGRGHAQGNQGNQFARSNHRDHAANGFHPEGYEGADIGRNGEAGEPADYQFGYMVTDFTQGTDFGHREERQEEHAQGEYHVVLPDGRKQTVSYEADERGFKPKISYQDTDDLARFGGYDSNANGRNHDGLQNGGHGNHGNGRSNGY